MSAQCFLCRFNNHRDAIDMNQFIEENVGFMNVDAVAREVHLELVNRNQGMTDSEAMTEQGVKDHITSHTLNPVIRVGVMLFGNLELYDKMKNDLYKVDSQGQCLGLDPKMIDAYLRLQNQVINLYKSDPSRLPYYKLHTNNSNNNSNQAALH